jgi:hypothetical protein
MSTFNSDEQRLIKKFTMLGTEGRNELISGGSVIFTNPWRMGHGMTAVGIRNYRYSDGARVVINRSLYEPTQIAAT